MKLTINNNNEKYELNIMQITQICGFDIIKKSFIVTSLIKYFSSAKYMNYEQKYVDNILIDNEMVGRKYFEAYCIKCRDDILNLLKISKSSRMTKYISNTLNGFDYQKELIAIEESVNTIFEKLNATVLSNFNNIALDYDVQRLWEIIQQSQIKGRDGKVLEELTNYELVEELLILFEELQKEESQKVMIILENIDHLLMHDEYKRLYNMMKKLTNNFDIWFIATLSIEGYTVFDNEYIQGINVVNDVIFTLPSKEHIKRFVDNNYPCYKEFSENEIDTWLAGIIHKIGKENIESDIRSNIVLKLINKSLCMNYIEKNGLNSIENSFLID